MSVLTLIRTISQPVSILAPPETADQSKFVQPNRVCDHSVHLLTVYGQVPGAGLYSVHLPNPSGNCVVYRDRTHSIIAPARISRRICRTLLGSRPVWAVITGLFLSSPASAQTVDEANLYHWAYAATFGTGVYDVGDDETVFVLRIPLKWNWRDATPLPERRVGFTIRFPVNFGVKDFDVADIFAAQFPDELRTFSFTPGIDAEIPMGSRWTLRSYGHFGWGTELGNENGSAWIYWAGVRSRLHFGETDRRFTLINGLTWAGYTPDQGRSQNLTTLLNGVEWARPLGNWKLQGHQVYFKPHVANYAYLNGFDFLFADGLNPIDVRYEWEIGLAIGKLKIFRFELDRLGLAYRFSDDTRGIRFVVGSLFQ